MNNDYPPLIPEFEKANEYFKGIQRIVERVIPPHSFEEAKLPVVCWSTLGEPPFDLSFFLLCPFKPHAIRFFYEMITRWLIPGNHLQALLQFSAQFSIPGFAQKLLCGEVIVRIESKKDFEILKKNLPLIEKEICLGVESFYRAQRIKEIKGLSADKKSSLIQENIVSLIKKRPQDFDYDVLSDMQHFLVHCKEEFKAERNPRHMSRIICVHYLFQKALKHSQEAYPERRYISVKLIRALISQKKSVLGLATGLSFIRDNEVLEEKHVFSAIHALIPDAKPVTGSYFINRRDTLATLYLEIEKERGRFSLDEERLLKDYFPLELKGQIKQMLNPLFMPQNEEEIMHHILSLSRELKFIKDLPQVIIDFSQQMDESLEFLVIVLRVCKAHPISISKSFETQATILEYIPDRIKIVGTLRKKYQKEASVFRVRIQKRAFLRKDHSLDLYRARQEVVYELTRVIGEFRDYNGGMISRETQVFENLRKNLGKTQMFLLENYFYSLNPPLMRTVLPLAPLKKLFLMLVEGQHEGLQEDQPFNIHIEEDKRFFYLLLMAKEGSFQKNLQAKIKGCEGQIVSCLVLNGEFPSFGIIAQKELGREIRLLIEDSMNEWAEKKFVYALKY